MKPLKNQNCSTTETALESMSYVEEFLPFPFYTPPPHKNLRGARAGVMNKGKKSVKRQPRIPSPTEVPESRIRPELGGGQRDAGRNDELA